MERPYERLMRYTKFETVSKEDTGVSPSTPEQTVFGKALAEEMKAIGLQEVGMDENGYVYGTIPAAPHCGGPVVALLAHMDVASASPCRNVHPSVIRYQGGDIPLASGAVMHSEDFPALRRYIGKSLIVTDGTTLLGADDKAGIAEIMGFAERLIANPNLPHGTVKVCFTPDEEIGSGAGLLDLARLGADFAYTMDGDAFGGVEYETFNAAEAKVAFHGVSVHPGSAKGILRNAILMAMDFVAALPASERPETTEGYEGYYFAERIVGGVEEAQVDCLIRDHDAERFEARKKFLTDTVAALNAKYGANTVDIVITDSYRNMKEKIMSHKELIDYAYEAVRTAGGEPFSQPVRGGTDGSALSYRGLPCPNLGTGGGNYHSRMEYACVEEMDSCVDMLAALVALFAEKAK